MKRTSNKFVGACGMALLLAAARLEADAAVSRRSSLLMGVLAGVGFALKPHFLAAWLLPGRKELL